MTTITTDRARLEELLGEYWEIAFEESSGVAATGNKANRVLHEIRALFDVKQAEIARLKAESEERLQNCAALVAEVERLRAALALEPERKPCEVCAGTGFLAGRFPGVHYECKVCATKAQPATAPAWYDAPTVPGNWISDDFEGISTFNSDDTQAFKTNTGVRWYGPIPPDGDKP